MDEYAKTNDQLLQTALRGDVRAQELLFTQNTGLVHHVVKRFSGRGHEAEDLFQIGCIGLLKAIRKFDLSYGVKFSTYAVPMIMGEIKRFIRDDGIIKVSRSLKETAAKAMKVRESLSKQNGEEPSLGEIAEVLHITSAELSVALEAGLQPESLYASGSTDHHDTRPLLDRLEEKTDYETEIVNKLTLEQLLSECSEREQTIITMRYYKQKTQTQIAQMLGISQVQVSRIEKKILLKMRGRLTEDTPRQG